MIQRDPIPSASAAGEARVRELPKEAVRRTFFSGSPKLRLLEIPRLLPPLFSKINILCEGGQPRSKYATTDTFTGGTCHGVGERDLAVQECRRKEQAALQAHARMEAGHKYRILFSFESAAV